MACSMGTVTDIMEDDSYDSDDASKNNMENPETKKLPPKKKEFSDFELQGLLANREEDQNDADGVKTAEVKTEFKNTPPYKNVSSLQLEYEGFISEEHQHLINENLSSLGTGNKASNSNILDNHFGDSLQQKILRLPKEGVLKEKFELQPNKLFKEKEDSIQEDGRHGYTEDCMFEVHSFDNEDLIDKLESSSSDESDVTGVFIPNAENGNNRCYSDTALYNPDEDMDNDIIRLAPNTKKDFIASKQDDDSSVHSSLRKGHVCDTGCFVSTEDEDTVIQNYTKYSAYKVHSFDKESPDKSEASSSKESDITTSSIPYGQNRSDVYSCDLVNNHILMLTPKDSKSFLIRTKSSDSAENTFMVLDEDNHLFPEKSVGLDTIISEDSSANTINNDYTDCESLEGSTIKALSDKTEASLCKEVDVTVNITPDTKCPQEEYDNYTEDYTSKHKSTENDSSLQGQIAEISAQILNLGPSRECVQDNDVKGCSSQTINTSLTGLAEKVSKRNEEMGYTLVTKKSIGDEASNITNSNDAKSKQTTNCEIPVHVAIEFGLKSYVTQLLDTSQDATSNFGTLMDKQSKQYLSTLVQILPSSFQGKTVQNIASTNTYNDVSQLQEATSGEEYFAYNFKAKEEKVFIPATTECASDVRKDLKYRSLVVSDNADEGNAPINAEESYQPYKYDLNVKPKLSAQDDVLEEQTSCSLWKILSNLECAFNWLPDIQVLDIPDCSMQEDLIHYLTEKEKEFSRAKTNIFREVVVYLVLAYEKACEDHLIDALADLSHCYSLLGNPKFIPAGIQIDFKDMHITPAKGDECYMKMKERRAQVKGRALRHHALQPSFDDENLFWGSEKCLSDGQNKQSEGGAASIQSQREMNLSNIHHLLNSSGCTLQQCDQSKAKTPNKNYLEKGIRNEAEKKLVNEDQQFFDIRKRSLEDKQERITSENNVNQPMSYMGSNLTASNITEKHTNVTEPKDCSPRIKRKEKDHIKGITLNSPTVGSEDGKWNSNDISQKMCSFHFMNDPASHVSLDDKYEETQPFLKLPLAFDETEDPCKATPIEERKMALIYAVTAAVAHVAYYCENYQESYVAAEVCKYWYSQLGKTGMATLLAVKGSVFLEYGIIGNKLGLPYLKKALGLDPDYWEWNLLCGKVISRLHGFLGGKNATSMDEELQLLEKAVQLNPNDASCLVHLANVYRSLSFFHHMAQLETEAKTKEIAQNIGQKMVHVQTKLPSTTIASYAMDYNKKWHNSQNIPISHIHKPLEQQQKDYDHLARELYLKALKVEQHCPYNNARCAKGLWSMPHPYKEKQVAQKAILHALTLAPSDSLVNHYAGMFYERAGAKRNSLECYKKAIGEGHFNYAAEICYINLKLNIGPAGYTPVIHLDNLLHKYPSLHLVVKTLCFKGYYLYKMEKKILLAIRSITTAIVMDPTHSHVKAFYPTTCFGRKIPAVNMYELLKEMLHSYWQSPQTIFNQEYWNGILETARRLTNECTENK